MENSEIIIGKWGKILAGKNAGMFVFVQGDAPEGGFFIFQSPERLIEKGFDNWVETLDGISKFFQFAGWEIEWLP